MRSGFFFKESLRGIKREKGNTLLSLLSLLMAFLLLDLYFVGAYNLSFFSERLQKGLVLQAFLEEGLTDSDRDVLQIRIGSLAGVAAVEYQSADSALAELERDLGESIAGELSANPLPASFTVEPMGERKNPEGLAELAEVLKALPGVEEVLYPESWAADLENAFAKTERLGMWLFFALSAGVVLLTANTIRLVLKSRAQAVALFALLGASKAFLTIPYYLEGIFLALVSALFAWLGVAWLILGVIRSTLPLSLFPFTVGLLILGFALILGLAGSFLGIKKELKV
ncbi:MAG: permease-like cell division protein FtsX [candidate division Zixibacteria bacterium]|nr:permease-like cell division protein FtsX [candidate division Zixibacteria bacterium]